MAAMMEQYSLRWNNFHSNLTNGFHSLLEASDMVDVTIAVDGSYLQAHKIVLSICSPYFKEMFKINPCRHPIVIIKDVAHRNMRDILEFMYLGEVNVLRENLPSFLRTAELLQVKGLTGDDSSDTSSKKDEKMDSLPDTEEEDFSVSEPENQVYPMPEYLPSTVPSVQTEQKPAKRIKSSTNANGKRNRPEPQCKTENVSNTDLPTHEMNMNDMNMKLEQTMPLGNFDICEDSRGEEATGQFDSSGPPKHENTINDQVGNFGQEWEVSHIKTNTTYKSGSKHEISADIGIKIGLRSINVTLKSDVEDHKALPKEVINYNERFDWTWDQGRFGFGPYAGSLQQEFRAAQYRGLPLPILSIMDYFVIDGEGYRYGRFYRTAGWYAHIAIWTAFPCWLMANILFRSVIRYGAYFLLIGGLLQLTGNLIWCVVRNPNILVIPFENATMITKYGLSFWMTFSCGLVSVVISILLIVMEKYFEEQLYEYFGVDSLNVYDVYTSEEVREGSFINKGVDIEMRALSLEKNTEYIHIARKSHHKPRITLKATKRPQTEQLTDEDIYENVLTEVRN